MFVPLVFVAVACLLTGLGVLLAVAVNTADGRTGAPSIAQVLYDAEHPEERRGRTARRR